MEDVAVIKLKKMKKVYIFTMLLLTSFVVFSQEEKNDTDEYKKRVLETAEVDFLMSYYAQNGNHASVTGGLGTEKLQDVTPTIIISLPLNDDDVLTVDAGISAYTSASSSNLNPFDSSGASRGGDDDDDDDDDDRRVATPITGSPWVESSGASRQDVWSNGTVSYAHSSNDRNSVFSANVGFAAEFDYTSFGFGAGFTQLFNDQNTEIGIKGQVYMDAWNPKYPTELDSYIEAGNNLNGGFFNGIDILNESGVVIDKNAPNAWKPFKTTLITDKARNSYSASVNFSQILSKNAQISLFFDIVSQQGWLSNPTQRVYFGDRPNFYIGNASSIPNYTATSNTDVFQLADDIERMPSSRFKIPVGMRFNYYVNEIVSLRTYYRYYTDDWGIDSHTASVEIPVKITEKFTLYPTYRYYQQTAADYFAPFEENLSTQEFYTSDYDLSKFDSNQFGLGIKYTDIFTKAKIYTFGIKTVDLRYNNYTRSDGLNAGIVSFGIKFVND